MPPDELDRDKIYSPASDDWDSDEELELEPPDAEIIAAEERRAAEAVDTHRKAIDIDEVYRDHDANRDSEIVTEWVEKLRNFRWQFQVRHLIVLTAVVAMLLAINQRISFGTMFIVGVMLVVAVVSLYLKLEENKRQEEADRRRRKMYAERRARQSAQTGPPGTIYDEDVEAEPPPEKSTDESAPPTVARSFRFQFSLSQMLIVMTVAAVLLGLGGAIGGMAGLATICGLMALVGLLVPVLGFNPPEVVVFAWWMVLALYVVLSLSAAAWVAMGGG